MRRKTLFFVVILIVVVLSGFIVYFFLGGEKNNEPVTNSKFIMAEDFSLPDTNGKLVSLSEVDAEVKIVNFWASWSPYSKDELLAFSKIKDEYNERVEILALNRDSNSGDAKKFLKNLNLNDDIIFVYDKNDGYYKKVKGYAVPETIFINNEEEVLLHRHGPMTYDEMRNKIEKILE